MRFPRLFRAASFSLTTKCTYLLLAALPSSPSQAGDIPAAMEHIVVTASRVDIPLDEVGSSVSVLSADQLRSRQYLFLSDSLREVPGLAVNRQGVAGSSTQVRVRGSEGNHVLVFIDGIEVNDLAQGSEFNFAHLLTQDIGQVEVVKGPQSALWGSDALGGVINIVSSKPEEPLAVNAHLESGSFESQNAGFSIASRSDRFYIRLASQYLNSAGNNISLTGNEKDGYRNITNNLLTGVELTDNLDLDMVVRHTEANNEYDGIDMISTGLPEDRNLETETSQLYGKITASLSLLDDQWEHKLSYALADTDNRNIDSGIQDSLSAGKRTSINYQSSFYFNSDSADHVFTLAFDHEQEEYHQRSQSYGPGFDPNKDLESATDSWTLEYRINLWNSLQVSASARQDDNDEFENSETYRLTASYSLDNETTRLHTAFGTGVKNPTFTERFGYFDGFKGNPDLQPEKSTGWEIGFEQHFMDHKIRADLTYFNEQLTDEINGFVFIPETYSYTSANMSGKSKRTGYELTARYDVTGNLYLQIAYTSLDAVEPEAGSDQPIDEIRRPGQNASISVNYNFINDKANLFLGVVYQGEQYDIYYPPYPREVERMTLDAFTLVNVSGMYHLSNRMTLFARVENLFDENYQEVYGFSSPGRGAYAGIRYKLN